MPAISLYEVSITTFQKALKALGDIIDKSENYAKERGEDPEAFVTASLIADMKPLSFQVQVVSNTIVKSVWRLTGENGGIWPDEEKTIAELKARIQKTADFLAENRPQVVGGEGRYHR